MAESGDTPQRIAPEKARTYALAITAKAGNGLCPACAAILAQWQKASGKVARNYRPHTHVAPPPAPSSV
ncbi:MAG: hypothetical protein GC129_06100 [Proteobacteria bacterium]|nr:hypothetical protein [Pseudomonadota bacterium]